MDKETTPRAYAAWEASIDDTGCVCRMETIWDTMTQLEIELVAMRHRVESAPSCDAGAESARPTKPITMKTTKMEFHTKLKTARKDLGLNQTQCAALLSIPFRTFCDWERGVTNPPAVAQEGALARLESALSADNAARQETI